MEVLRTLRKRIRISQGDLAKELGVSRSTIATWESNNNDTVPDASMLMHLARYFGVTVDYLLGMENKDETPEGSHIFPVIGEVAAGYDLDAYETYTGDEIEIPDSWLRAPSSEYFVLRATGESMWPDIRDRDLLLVHKMPEVNSGAVAIVICPDGTGTVKRVKYSPGGGFIELIPRNPQYPHMCFEGADAENVRIQGEVSMIIREL